MKGLKVFLLIFLIADLGCSPEESRKPVRVIFDSDMGPDYDDVGAIAVLHALADRGEAEILATVASTDYEGGECTELVKYLIQPPGASHCDSQRKKFRIERFPSLDRLDIRPVSGNGTLK